MAAPEIEKRFLTAGREYGIALADLGLDPHALFWAFDEEEDQHILVLITDFFDFKGPLEISKQLFRAYNAAATPKEIDPFVIRLHSVNQPVGRSLLSFAGGGWEINKIDKTTGKPIGESMKVSGVKSAGLDLRPEWIIKVRSERPVRKSIELSRRWNRFARNIDRIAA
jgi:hypothetical protein